MGLGLGLGMGVSNNITAVLNLIATLASIPIIASGIWLASKQCEPDKSLDLVNLGTFAYWSAFSRIELIISLSKFS